jgi:glycosyltransferase involved in cell wall biosynthesis
MKLVVLHPPLYPVNHEFFNELGKYIDLVVFSFGSQPGFHSQWSVQDFIDEKNTYELKIIEGASNLKSYTVPYRMQLNPSVFFKIKKEKPDIVMSIAFWFPSLYMALFKKMFGYKFIILTDAIYESEKNNSNIRKFIRKIIAKKVDLFVAGSEQTVDYLKNTFPNVKIENSTQTIDVVKWIDGIKNLSSKEILRKELNLPNDKVILLSIGSFIELKNLDKLIEIALLIEECCLVIIGEGVLKSTYEKKIKLNNASSKIKLISKKQGDALKKYYKASDIFVFPSLKDTFGYVVVEALASGLPVVCSQNSGVSSVIKEGVNGYIIDPEENFINTIYDTILNLPKLSANAIDSIKDLTFENRAKEFMSIINIMYENDK